MSSSASCSPLHMAPIANPGLPFIRPLTNPDAFPPVEVVTRWEVQPSQALSQPLSASITTAAATEHTQRKRERSEGENGYPAAAVGAPDGSRYPQDASAARAPRSADILSEHPQRPFPLLDVSAPTLPVTDELRSVVAAHVTATTRADIVNPSSLASSSPSSPLSNVLVLCRQSAAADYFAKLYRTPEKLERDTRRRVDYDASRKHLQANRSKDDLDACVSCLTRGQHAHYTPLLRAGVYSVTGRRLRRPANTPQHPDAATVAELAEAEQTDFKLKLMYAVCTCPRCRWYPPHHSSSSRGKVAATASTTTMEASAEPHEHLNYNFIDHLHVMPFASRLRLHRTEKYVLSFLQMAAALAGRQVGSSCVAIATVDAGSTGETRDTRIASFLEADEEHNEKAKADVGAEEAEEERVKHPKTKAEKKKAAMTTAVTEEGHVWRITHEDFAIRYRRLESGATKAVSVHSGSTVVASTVLAATATTRASAGTTQTAAASATRVDYALLDALNLTSAGASNSQSSSSSPLFPAPLSSPPRNVIPLTAHTLHALRDLWVAATKRTCAASAAAFYPAVCGVALTMTKRALHTLLCAHVNDEFGEGKCGFRIPVRVTWDVGDAEAGSGGGGTILRVCLGHPLPRPLESRRETLTSAAKQLLRHQGEVPGEGDRNHGRNNHTGRGEGQDSARRPQWAAEVTLTRSAGAATAAAAAATTASGRVVPPVPSSLGFQVMAGATTTTGAPATTPVFDLVKMDYLYGKHGEGAAAAGVRTSLFATTPAAAAAAGPVKAPLLEAFRTTEALELSLLFRCFPTATVRVSHVNAYTGAIVHVDKLTAATWEPLLLRRAALITAPIPGSVLDQQRARSEVELVAAAARHDCAASLENAGEEEGSTEGKDCSGEDGKRLRCFDPQAYATKNTFDNPRNRLLYLAHKDESTNMALESLLDVRYAWDALFDLLAAFAQQVALVTVRHWCAAAGSASYAKVTPTTIATPRHPLAEGGELALMLVKYNVVQATWRRAKADHHYHASTTKLNVNLCEVEALYPWFRPKHDPKEEATSLAFLEKASMTVCEREYRGLREWPYSNQIPMTFRLRDR